uniref:hypothetical protein n=1 Tax=Vibrio parahaemolyticus TaxID=670 RepID=UPI002738D459|nr:hypothetical protein [Vibrio parahaemolyticus]WKV19631.1 hypothetical protein [Vibrio parahaemolyticus]
MTNCICGLKAKYESDSCGRERITCTGCVITYETDGAADILGEWDQIMSQLIQRPKMTNENIQGTFQLGRKYLVTQPPA